MSAEKWREEFLAEIRCWDWFHIKESIKLFAYDEVVAENEVEPGEYVGRYAVGKGPFTYFGTCPSCGGKGVKASSDVYSFVGRLRGQLFNEFTFQAEQTFGHYGKWPEEVSKIEAVVVEFLGSLFDILACLDCGGTGSQEGYKYSIWRECLEEVAASQGLFIEEDEEDPRLLFVCGKVPREEIFF